MGTLILLSAIPGSGKSTWARKYQEKHPDTYIVASDEIRKRIAGACNRFHAEHLVWETFLAELNAHACEDCTVIADSTNLQNAYRRYYFQNTPGYDKHILVLFDVPFDVCLKQNRMRTDDRVVPDDAMESLRKEFESPTQDVIDLYDEYLIVDQYHNVRKAK